MNRIILTFSFLALIGSAACTSKREEGPEVKDLKSRVQALESEAAKFDDKIKAASNDPGLQVKLAQDSELAKARLERMREALSKAQAKEKELE